jgi:hypothetical protein
MAGGSVGFGPFHKNPSRNVAAEVAQIRPQLVPDTSEDCHAFVIRADERGGRIVQVEVKTLAGS